MLQRLLVCDEWKNRDRRLKIKKGEKRVKKRKTREIKTRQNNKRERDRKLLHDWVKTVSIKSQGCLTTPPNL